MGISESQLERWTHQPSATLPAKTRQAIYEVLTEHMPEDIIVRCDVYLQGSYRNGTNVRGDSDVDVVIEQSKTFNRDITSLSDAERDLYLRTFSKADYLWEDFRRDVIQALHKGFGRVAVTGGNKCLKVAGVEGVRLPADVVVANEYRRYLRFRGLSDQDFIPGIWFKSMSDGREIINYPKVHYENGTKKMSATNDRFKPTVRMFKNMRNRMIDRDYIKDGLAPSYFLESLIYNVPQDYFEPERQKTALNIINWGSDLSRAKAGHLVCQNEQIALFGNTQEQWSLGEAREFAPALEKFWKDWS